MVFGGQPTRFAVDTSPFRAYMKEATMPELSPLLRFDPSWVKDPVPWPWLFEKLDRGVLVQLVTVQLQLQKSMLEVQLKAAQQTLDIIGKVKPG